jgi:hypothetical protein
MEEAKKRLRVILEYNAALRQTAAPQKKVTAMDAQSEARALRTQADALDETANVPAEQRKGVEDMARRKREEAELLKRIRKVAKENPADIHAIWCGNLTREASAYYRVIAAIANCRVHWIDVALDQDYQGILERIRDILAGADFKDFPGKFKPVVKNLLPTSWRNITWEDDIAPALADFDERVQSYYHRQPAVSDQNKDLAEKVWNTTGALCHLAVMSAENYRDKADRTFSKTLGEKKQSAATGRRPNGARRNSSKRNAAQLPLLDAARLRVRVNGTWYDVTDDQTSLLSVLFQAKGVWTQGPNLGVRPDKTIKRMPEEVQKIIESSKPNGYRIPALLPR